MGLAYFHGIQPNRNLPVHTHTQLHTYTNTMGFPLNVHVWISNVRLCSPALGAADATLYLCMHTEHWLRCRSYTFTCLPVPARERLTVCMCHDTSVRITYDASFLCPANSWRSAQNSFLLFFLDCFIWYRHILSQSHMRMLLRVPKFQVLQINIF